MAADCGCEPRSTASTSFFVDGTQAAKVEMIHAAKQQIAFLREGVHATQDDEMARSRAANPDLVRLHG